MRVFFAAKRTTPQSSSWRNERAPSIKEISCGTGRSRGWSGCNIGLFDIEPEQTWDRRQRAHARLFHHASLLEIRRVAELTLTHEFGKFSRNRIS